MKEPTKEQVLDALQTHKTVQKAANSIGMSKPKFEYWMRKYGIRYVSKMPFVKIPWYKRILMKVGIIKPRLPSWGMCVK